MRNPLILLLLIICTSQYTTAQNVGIGTNAPNGVALLDISSTTKGVLLPRMNTTQMNAILAPVGLLIFNTDSSAFAYQISEGPWVYMKGSTDLTTKWSTKGNAGTNKANDFIGTTDNVDLVFKRNNLRAGLVGGSNTSFGLNALNPTTSGRNNTSVGNNTLFSNITGDYNTANGDSSLFSNTQGNYNTANGAGSLFSNTGNNNTANGFEALYTLKATQSGGHSASNNTAVGSMSGRNSVGFGNIFLGFKAGYYESGSNKLYINNSDADANNSLIYGEFGNKLLRINGNLTAQKLSVGSYSVATDFIGTSTDVDLVFKRNNKRVGFINENLGNTSWGNEALNPATSGINNTANGFKALFNNTPGANNTANGALSLFNNTIGNNNTANGSQSLFNNTTGNSNTAIGTAALQSNVTGHSNTATGLNVLASNTAGSRNTGIGLSALISNISGENNTAIGVSAGSASTGSNNIFLGYFAGFQETGNNKLYIQNSFADANNALIYGEFDNKLLRVNGKLDLDSWSSQATDVNGNGYANMGGVLMQWGSVPYNASATQPVTFPIAFTSTSSVYSLTLTVDAGNNSGPGVNIPAKSFSITKDGFLVAGTAGFSGASGRVRWIAIGK